MYQPNFTVVLAFLTRDHLISVAVPSPYRQRDSPFQKKDAVNKRHKVSLSQASLSMLAF